MIATARSSRTSTPRISRSKEDGRPLTIGLLADTSMSQLRLLEQERGASHTFLDQVLRERDQGFTSSREKLRAALDELHRPARSNTLFFDAVKGVRTN